MNIILDMYSLRGSWRQSSGRGICIYKDRRFNFGSQNFNGKWSHGHSHDCLGRKRQVRGGPRKEPQGTLRWSRGADVRKRDPEVTRKQGEKQGGYGAAELKGTDSFSTWREWPRGQEKRLKNIPCTWKSLVTLAQIWCGGGMGTEPSNCHLLWVFLADVNENGVFRKSYMW